MMSRVRGVAMGRQPHTCRDTVKTLPSLKCIHVPLLQQLRFYFLLQIVQNSCTELNTKDKLAKNWQNE